MPAEELLDSAGEKYDEGLLDEALAGFRRAAAAADTEGEAELLSEARYWTGCVLSDLGDRDEAVCEFGAALDGLVELGDELGAAECRMALGRTHELDGAPDLAVAQYEKALEVFRRWEASLPVAHALVALGAISIADDPRATLELLAEAVAIFESEEEWMEAVRALLDIFDLSIAAADLAAAERTARRAQADARVADDPDFVAIATIGLGTALLAGGDLAGAERAYLEAREHFLRTDQPALVARCDINLAQVARERHDLPAARTLAETCLRRLRAEEEAFAEEIAEALKALGTILYLAEERDAAERSFAEARERFVALDDREQAADCAIYLVAIMVNSGRAAEAAPHVASAGSFYATRSSEERWFYDYYAAGYHHAMGDSRLALLHFSSAATALAVRGDRIAEAGARMGMGLALFGLGHAASVASWEENNWLGTGALLAGREDFELSLAAQVEAVDILIAAAADPVTIGSALQNVASVLVSLGRVEEARESFEEARIHITADRAPLELAKLDFNQSRLHLRAAAVITDNSARDRELQSAIDLLLPAMLYLDAQRYLLAHLAGRRAWTSAFAAQARQVALTIALALGRPDLVEEILTATRASGVLALTPPDVVPLRIDDWASGLTSTGGITADPLTGLADAGDRGEALTAAFVAPGLVDGALEIRLQPGPLIRTATGRIALASSFARASRRYATSPNRLHLAVVVEPRVAADGSEYVA